ncbi:MAG: hypothetical protein AABX70_07580 [Nanoarchaeota archaeon]
MRYLGIILIFFLLSSFAAAYQYTQNPQLVLDNQNTRYAYRYTPYYDTSSNWQRGYLGPYYMPGLHYTPDGTEAATYPPLYGSAQYNPYADDRNLAVYQQNRDATRQYLQANEIYDDLNYPAKQQEYLRFFAQTDPRYYWMTPGMYPYGKKPYFKKYGTNPGALGTIIPTSVNPFWGTTYARNFHCNGPNFGCHVHNTFPDSSVIS